MFIIDARNVNDAYAEATYKMSMVGVPKDSRVGKTLSAPWPVMTVYRRPTERMLMDFERDANPFFHIFEGIWMLAGRNDVAWLAQFNPRMAEFSDDGVTFHGTYGFRWREHFGVDQLKCLIQELRANKGSRRIVLAMWDPGADLGKIATGLDVPCNTTVYLLVREGVLDMTVCCRSNDIIWGCYGANAVHMSMLQEFIAQAISMPVGRYYQISNDWHIYEQHFHLLGKLPLESYPYPSGHVPLTNSRDWEYDMDEGLPSFIASPLASSEVDYVRLVLQPMLYTWKLYKKRDREGALKRASTIKDEAVKLACFEWLVRRNWE